MPTALTLLKACVLSDVLLFINFLANGCWETIPYYLPKFHMLLIS